MFGGCGGQEEGKFVHEWGILCAELVVSRKFVHEWGILCAELRGVLGKGEETYAVCRKWLFIAHSITLVCNITGYLKHYPSYWASMC